MDIHKKKILGKIDGLLDWKLEHLKSQILRELKEVPVEDLEQYVTDLKIAAIFCTNEDDYNEVQSELSQIIQRISSKDADKSLGRTILRKLCGKND